MALKIRNSGTHVENMKKNCTILDCGVPRVPVRSNWRSVNGLMTLTKAEKALHMKKYFPEEGDKNRIYPVLYPSTVGVLPYNFRLIFGVLLSFPPFLFSYLELCDVR